MVEYLGIYDALTNSEFWKTMYDRFIDDFIGFSVLCVACVLLLSYLREKPPEFEKKRILVALYFLFIGAFAARTIAHYASFVLEHADIIPDPDKKTAVIYYLTVFIPKEVLGDRRPAEGLLNICEGEASYNNCWITALARILMKGFKNLGGYPFQKYILINFALTTVISLTTICAGAFILMKFFKAKHIVPMVIVQAGGFLLKEIFKNPYASFVKLIANLPPFKLGVSEGKLCGYNGFAYGCFMILLIIGYILITKRQYESFWTKNVKVRNHFWPLIGLFCAYTVLMLLYNYISSKDNSQTSVIVIAFQIMIYVILAAVFLFVPQRTYAITRGELQEEFFEVKRIEEVEQYSYSESQIKAQRKYMHDLPGHFRALASMAKGIGAEEIEQYVQDLDESLLQTKGEFSTGNAFLDDFLYNKKKQLAKHDIELVFQGVFPSRGVRKIDITTIFHNLIENAFEACAKVPGKREIRITSKIHGDRVYISFFNPFVQKAEKKQGKYVTRKKDKEFHGYGLSNVESVAKKKEYDGTFSKKQEGNIFIAEVNLRFEHR